MENTPNQLYKNIMQHLEFAEVIKRLSNDMHAHAENGSAEKIDSIAENRQRVVNLLQIVQQKIEDKIPELKDQEEIEVIKAWHGNFNDILREIDRIDRALLHALEEQKTQTKREIGNVYSNHQKISAYNHSEKRR